MITAVLVFTHLFAVAIGVAFGAYRTAPQGEELPEGFVELEGWVP